jgi:hypothetical protein
MNEMNCTQARHRLEDLLDGYLSAADAAATELHLAECRACAAERQAAETLRTALRAMPAPELRPGFADAVLAEAARQHAPRVAPRRRSWPRLDLWVGAAIGAAATAALVALLLSAPQQDPSRGTATPPGISVALHEVREIGVAIESDAAVAGATMTVLLEGGIDLVGFGERREVRWQTDLDAGTNMLSLPIIAHSLEEGRLTALVEHGVISQRIDVRVHVAPAPLN